MDARARKNAGAPPFFPPACLVGGQHAGAGVFILKKKGDEMDYVEDAKREIKLSLAGEFTEYDEIYSLAKREGVSLSFVDGDWYFYGFSAVDRETLENMSKVFGGLVNDIIPAWGGYTVTTCMERKISDGIPEKLRDVLDEKFGESWEAEMTPDGLCVFYIKPISGVVKIKLVLFKIRKAGK